MGSKMGRTIFVIGGARSGKSAFAEQLAADFFSNITCNNANLCYLATAQACDDEMRARIKLHQNRRSKSWKTIEAPFNLSEALTTCSDKNQIILIDCLSVWTTNLLIANVNVEKARNKLMDAIKSSQATIILVASETGLGIVPETPLTRQFRDENGITNQAIAELANEVYFLVAAIAQKIKP